MPLARLLQLKKKKKIKKVWLTNKKTYLEDGLVDVGSATKYLLEQAKVSTEKKRPFKG